MNALRSASYALYIVKYGLVGACFTATLLAACGGANSGLSSSTATSTLTQSDASALPSRRSEPSSVRPDAGATYKLLYSFEGGKDGANAEPLLIDVQGLLYGTTAGGGGSGCKTSGCGTIFDIKPSGMGYGVLDRLAGAPDGAEPIPGVIDANGTLYGTTYAGGIRSCKSASALPGCGTVFAVNLSGKEYRVLYSFKGGTDAAAPIGGLTDVDGMLYGTSFRGGGAKCDGLGCGTVFAVNPATGAESITHTFCPSSCADGAFPLASLVNVQGVLYGTTDAGGAHGNGTVFAMTTSGNEDVLYSFKAGKDGAQPDTLLIDVGGTLYGTTEYGGVGCSGGSPSTSGCGTVFKVNSSTGAESVVYSFKGGADGWDPNAVISISGILYGTTAYGGGSGCGGGGCGTVFDVDPATGTESVLYRFTGGTDGDTPANGLTEVSGTLYGTTYFGGGSKCEKGNGCGTIFELRP